MRFFEIVLLLVVTILPFVKRRLVTRIQPNYILLFLGAVMALHLIFEGYRWQMFPAYLLVIILAWRVKMVNPTKTAHLSFLRIAGFFGISVLIILAWILPIVLPVFSLPEPRGSYNVGTEMVYVKTDREEKITEDPDDSRELLYKIWYPSNADISDFKSERYVDRGSRAGFATKYGLPPSALNYLDHVKTYVYPEIPAAKEKFPVLIFSHGYSSKATGYYSLLTELASQGYVIINMNHTYESLGVTFPDGRIKYFDYDYQRKISEGSMEEVQPIIDAFKDSLSYEQRHPIVRKTVRDYFEGKIQDRWAEDMISTMDLLRKWNSEGILENKLDLDKIGVIGHSVGGGAVGNVAMKDPRVKAAVNLDGIQWGTMIDSTYHIPYLYISADWPADHEDINSHIYINKSDDYFYDSKLLKSGHPNFMDIPFMIPVNSLAGTGEIDPYRGMQIVTQTVTSFFDRHLKHLPKADPKKLSEQYDLLEMKVYKGNSVK